MELHTTSVMLNYVLGCSYTYNPLRKRVSNKCMVAYIYFRSFRGKRYLTRLGMISSKVSFLFTVIALHKCYALLSIASGLLLLDNTIFSMEF